MLRQRHTLRGLRRLRGLISAVIIGVRSTRTSFFGGESYYLGVDDRVLYFRKLPYGGTEAWSLFLGLRVEGLEFRPKCPQSKTPKPYAPLARNRGPAGSVTLYRGLTDPALASCKPYAR